MKEWTVDEFIAECEQLCRNEYTYDCGRMPDGICNGHKVGKHKESWTGILIDNVIYQMGVFNEMWPDGSVSWICNDGKMLNSLEYVRSKLCKPA